MSDIIKHIVKRDGTIVYYDRDRIATAIFKAAAAVGGNDRAEAESLAKEVEAKLIVNFGVSATPSKSPEELRRIVLDLQCVQVLKTVLDRMSQLNLLQDTFTMPENINPSEFFKDCFGIITNQNSPKRIALRVEPTQAKYFRALPLHSSQQETVQDQYSIFTYQMRITYDLKEELMSHGASTEVLEPQELKMLIRNELEQALKNYQ